MRRITTRPRYSDKLTWRPGRYARMGDEKFLAEALKAVREGLSLSIKTMQHVNAIQSKQDREKKHAKSMGT